MSKGRKPGSRILGVGHHVPPRKVTNEDLAKVYGIDTNDEWIVQRSGIKSRYFVDEGMTSTELSYQATLKACEMAGIKKNEIDAIVYATLSPDHEFPGGGCFLQAKLEVPGIPAFDIRNQCSGFIYGLQVADGLVRTGAYKRVLVVGAEIHSRGLDLTTRGRDVAVLFGDGAGAAIVGPADDGDRGILSIHLHADGSFAKELWLEAPGCGIHPKRISHEMIDDGRIYPQMNGKTVFLHAARRMPEVMMEALKANEMSVADMNLFVPHQANIRINEAAAKALGLAEGVAFNTIENYGNTTAATIPIGLSEACKAGKLKPGSIVGLAAFGSGFTWASALIRW